MLETMKSSKPKFNSMIAEALMKPLARQHVTPRQLFYACLHNSCPLQFYHRTPSSSPAMASEATPRIHAKYLDSFTNQIVRILGKVVSLRGDTATIDANGSINLHLNRVRTLRTSLKGC